MTEGRVPGRASAVVATNRLDSLLLEALDALLAQDYPDMEIVLVLDGVQGAPALAERVGDRVRIVGLPEHVGTARALNAGIAASTGEFIVRLDADDRSAPERTSLQVRYLSERPGVVAVGGNANLIDEQGRKVGEDIHGSDGDQRGTLLLSNTFVHSSMCFRADALERIGGYNPACVRMQDYELYLRLGREGEVHRVPEIITDYRIHANQNSRNSPVFSRATREISRGRRRLGKTLHVPTIKVAMLDAVWIGWQVLRHYGVVKPLYTRGLVPQRRS